MNSDKVKVLWAMDECAPDAEGFLKAWRRLFGEEFDKEKALATTDCGDCFRYDMPDGIVGFWGIESCTSIEQHFVLEWTDERRERCRSFLESHRLAMLHCDEEAIHNNRCECMERLAQHWIGHETALAAVAADHAGGRALLELVLKGQCLECDYGVDVAETPASETIDPEIECLRCGAPYGKGKSLFDRIDTHLGEEPNAKPE